MGVLCYRCPETTIVARSSKLAAEPTWREPVGVKWRRSRRGSSYPFAHVEILEGRQLLAMITVNTVNDINSAGAALSLRQAIEISNGTLDVSSLTMLQQAQVQGASPLPTRSTSTYQARKGRSTTLP